MRDDTYYLNDVSELAELLIFEDEELKESGKIVSALCKYDLARALIKELILCGYDLKSIDIEPDEYCDYVGEYSVELVEDGVVCEKVRYEEKFLWDGSDVSYFAGDVNSLFIKRYTEEGTTVKYFEMKESEGDSEDDSECNYDCANCDYYSEKPLIHVSDGDDGEHHGFTASKSDGNSYHSYSYYSTESLGMDDIHRMLNEVGF